MTCRWCKKKIVPFNPDDEEPYFWVIHGKDTYCSGRKKNGAPPWIHEPTSA